MKKGRLDQLVFDRGLTDSRERAKTSIMAGLVFVNGQRCDKPGTPVAEDAQIELRGDAIPYVSRGGLKLEKARKVYAIDVGYGQLAWSIRSDERVVVMERTNVRYVTPDMLDETPQLAVMDLSFISIKLVLPVVRELLPEDGTVICLIKPQFEAGKDKVGKKGVVRERSTHVEVVRDVLDFVASVGYTALGLDYSPIRGPEGNIEYLLLLKKGEYDAPALDPQAVVEASHAAFGA